MKRTIITALAMLPTALLATPALVGAVDRRGWTEYAPAVYVLLMGSMTAQSRRDRGERRKRLHGR
jgi:hypothetical protein